MRKQQFSVSALSQHICLLSLLLVLVLAPTTQSHLSLSLHPLKIYIMQVMLHMLVGSCLRGRNRRALLYCTCGDLREEAEQHL